MPQCFSMSERSKVCLSSYKPGPTMSMLLLWLAMLWMMQVSDGSLTDSQKQEILEAHNYYRGLVDPIATDMLRMVREVNVFCTSW